MKIRINRITNIKNRIFSKIESVNLNYFHNINILNISTPMTQI